MDRVLANFTWLLSLVKTNKKTYIRRIDRASFEDIKSILCCVESCANLKVVRDRKSLRQLRRRVEVETARSVFRRNEICVKACIALVLHRLVYLAVQHVIESC